MDLTERPSRADAAPMTDKGGRVFVGREQELGSLRAALADRVAQPCCLVGGEAGIGKTRLIKEFVRQAAADGATVVSGGCLELGADVLPFAPFVEALDRLGELAASSGAAVSGFGPNPFAMPPPLLNTSNPGRISEGQERGRLYEAVRGFLDRGPDPLVLVLEDLHWADRSTLELLDYLVRRLRLGRTFVLASFRSDELHRRHPLVPVLAEFARSGRTTRIDLSPLSDADVSVLIRDIRGSDAPPSLVAGIVERSEGNPFLAQELLALGVHPGGPLPATLRGVLLARIERLSESAGEVARIASISGRPVDPELLECAWGGAPEDLEVGLRECLDRSILTLNPNDGGVSFHHALLAEAVEGDLLPGTRVRLHGRLARLLVERPDLASPTAAGATAELAHHWYEAHELTAAFEACVRAAEAAVQARAYPEALRAYERAVELWDKVPDASVRAGSDLVDLLDRAARTAILTGERARGLGLQRQAVELVDPLREPLRAGYLMARLAGAYEFAGEIPAMIRTAEEAVEILPRDPPTSERAEALAMLAEALGWQGRYAESGLAAREAAELAAVVGASAIEALARDNLAFAHAGLCRDEEAIAESERAVGAANRSGDSEALLWTYTNRIALFRWLWRPADAEWAIEEAREIVRRHGVGEWSEIIFQQVMTRILSHLGRWDEAVDLATDALADEAGLPTLVGGLRFARGILRVRRGEVEGGEADLRAAQQSHDDAQGELDVRGAFAEAALARGQPDVALSILREAAAESDQIEDVVARASIVALRLRAAADHLELVRARRQADGQGTILAEAASDRALLEAALEGRFVAGAGVAVVLDAVGVAGGFRGLAGDEGDQDGHEGCDDRGDSKHPAPLIGRKGPGADGKAGEDQRG